MRLPSDWSDRPMTALFFLFSAPVNAPVTLLFGASAFSFAISTIFPVFGAHRRPVNRLLFFYRAMRARSDRQKPNRND
jgi:hypothetical protein